MTISVKYQDINANLNSFREYMKAVATSKWFLYFAPLTADEDSIPCLSLAPTAGYMSPDTELACFLCQNQLNISKVGSQKCRVQSTKP